MQLTIHNTAPTHTTQALTITHKQRAHRQHNERTAHIHNAQLLQKKVWQNEINTKQNKNYANKINKIKKK